MHTCRVGVCTFNITLSPMAGRVRKPSVKVRKVSKSVSPKKPTKPKSDAPTQLNTCHLCRKRHDHGLAAAPFCACPLVKGVQVILYCSECLTLLDERCKRCHYRTCCCLLPRATENEVNSCCPLAVVEAIGDGASKGHQCCYLRYQNRRHTVLKPRQVWASISSFAVYMLASSHIATCCLQPRNFCTCPGCKPRAAAARRAAQGGHSDVSPLVEQAIPEQVSC
jgi:hypothetical protein